MNPLNLPAWLHSVHHDGSDLYISNPLPRLGETVTLRMRNPPDAHRRIGPGTAGLCAHFSRR
jgi:hypothetical protein